MRFKDGAADPGTSIGRISHARAEPGVPAVCSELFAQAAVDDEVGAVDIPGHLAAYAGLAPVTKRSSSSIKGEHPSKGGNKALKRAMFLSAFASLSDPVSRTYYDKKRGEGKKHNAALICLARRRCDVIYAMLRDKQPYQRDRKPAPQAA